MEMNPQLAFGLIIFRFTRGHVRTNACKQYLHLLRAKRKEYNAALQAELDAEHSRGWAVRYIDGKKVTFAPFASK